jgi:undecaprenyl-diphosphatase
MTIFESIILGVVEGITEFLPISSTAHMIVAADMMGLAQTDAVSTFEVAIQLGAVLSVIFAYKDKLFAGLDIWMKIAIAFVPMGAIGFVFHDAIKALFGNQHLIYWMFIIGGIAFIIIEYFYKEEETKIKSLEQIDYKTALYVGLFQALALIPGMSRAGASILGGMLVKINRMTATEFSFLLAIPTMFAATGLDVVKNYSAFSFDDWGTLGVGFVTAFVVAYATLKLLLGFISRFSFVPFGIYRILLGLFFLFVYVDMA